MRYVGVEGLAYMSRSIASEVCVCVLRAPCVVLSVVEAMLSAQELRPVFTGLEVASQPRCSQLVVRVCVLSLLSSSPR